MKKILIKNCAECPYRSSHYNFDEEKMIQWCSNSMKYIKGSLFKIREWCKLKNET